MRPESMRATALDNECSRGRSCCCAVCWRHRLRQNPLNKVGGAGSCKQPRACLARPAAALLESAAQRSFQEAPGEAEAALEAAQAETATRSPPAEGARIGLRSEKRGWALAVGAAEGSAAHGAVVGKLQRESAAGRFIQ